MSDNIETMNPERGNFLIKKTVLIVDDEEINVEIMSAILADDFHVLTANDGKEALDILLSGDHKKVDEWREEQSIERTKNKRPALYDEYIKSGIQ